uniref:Uncharacterized protein n=1 Tax=Romanomermis culicivorax TaxID=13658 RepID=A0A915IXQ0_ROMCU
MLELDSNLLFKSHRDIIDVFWKVEISKSGVSCHISAGHLLSFSAQSEYLLAVRIFLDISRTGRKLFSKELSSLVKVYRRWLIDS